MQTWVECRRIRPDSTETSHIIEWNTTKVVAMKNLRHSLMSWVNSLLSLFLILDLILCSYLPRRSWSNFHYLFIPQRFSCQVLKLFEHIKLIMWDNRLIGIDIFIWGGHRNVFLVQTDDPFLMLLVFHRTLSYEIGRGNKILDRVWFLWLVQIVMRFLFMRLL